MHHTNDYLVSQVVTAGATQPGDAERWMIRSALKLYQRARAQGRLCRLWAILTGRLSHLLDLSHVEASCLVRDRCYAGVQSVPLRQIRGSAGRSHDFDAVFHPRQGRNKGRWLRIAVARQMGTYLPPVELVRIGDAYFVRDGHHRISVAHAMGQACIEAEVVNWQVTEPLPWHVSAPAPVADLQ